ncbi:MAG TPA: hypothetical protein VK447_05310 [Myxococcaceae bacterium]|nr:hypothetical protein [Myxococcaceae bacterium]
MRKPYGRINFTALILLAAIAAGLYAVILFAPVYADDWDVKEAINIAHNQIGKLSDGQARELIRGKLHYVGTHQQYDLYGNLKTVQGLGLSDEAIVIERDHVRGTALIRVDYEREVYAKLIKRTFRVKFHPQRSGPVLK